ncbi:transporter substrate-binding domain-containing protein [Glutamicibacter sp. M10]|uniref:transporter substrate-binding domain-containing protein n=1 Tax=Glutamicibacter sp. M10 TaxID=3023076 RepID=UPI0037C1AB3D
MVPEKISADGKLTIVTAPSSAPLSFYATDNTTPIGNDADLAAALADALGLELELVPVSWADWPLGIESAKYEAAISNVTVTEERKRSLILRPTARTCSDSTPIRIRTLGQSKKPKMWLV